MPDNEKIDLIDLLHNKNPLPSLRTYQGDIAKFIQSKDKSLADLAITKKKIEESREVNHTEIDEGDKNNTNSKRNFSINFLISALSIILIVASIMAIAYIGYFKNSSSIIGTKEGESVISTNKDVSVNYQNLSIDSLRNTLSEIRSNDSLKGITAIRISRPDQKRLATAEEFISKLNLEIPSSLIRSLNTEFIIGVYNKSANKEFFIIFKTKDYGIAFRDMLAWENNIIEDLSPLLLSSASSSVATEYEFRDIIVKNKDTRAYATKQDKIKLIYTFINDDIILITESEEAISNLVNSIVSKATER